MRSLNGANKFHVVSLLASATEITCRKYFFQRTAATNTVDHMMCVCNSIFLQGHWTERKGFVAPACTSLKNTPVVHLLCVKNLINQIPLHPSPDHNINPI